jgi:phosphatidylserine/phosphatidylglycerophosphate/cardiolipin synthase-like enzyme
MTFTYLEHDELYGKALLESLTRAGTSLWMATANLKQTLVEPTTAAAPRRRRKHEPVVSRLAALARSGVDVRLLHGGAPSRPFMESLRESCALEEERFAMRRCPRVHLKAIVVDGCAAYTGSANLTGAGLGAKSPDRRNFEVGFWIEDEEAVARLRDLFSAIWGGAFCPDCGRKDVCGEPLAGPDVRG